jgi:hypothetical protein
MSNLIQAATPRDAFLVLTNVSTTEMQVFNGLATKAGVGSKVSRLNKAKPFENQ